MANTRKRKKPVRRRVRKMAEPLSKLDQHYIALHSCYKAAIVQALQLNVHFGCLQTNAHCQIGSVAKTESSRN